MFVLCPPGLASLLERPCDLDLAETPVLPKAVQLHLREDASFPRTGSSPEVYFCLDESHKQLGGEGRGDRNVLACSC